MRKKFLGALIAAAALSAAPMTVFAAPASTTVCTAYVDADGNGICDNCNAVHQGCNYVDENGDGICDNYAAGGRGRYCIDADGDGICDNYLTGNGCGRGRGRGYGCGRGGRFR